MSDCCQSNMAAAARFQPARLIAGRVSPTLELVSVITARVNPPQVSQVMQTLVAELPLGPLQHLKRVRKPTDGPGCELILAPCPLESPATDNSSLLEQLPPATSQVLQALNASIGVARVPKAAPDNRGQWEEWCSIWPMPWKVPTGVQEQDGETVSAVEQAYFEHFMTMVFQHTSQGPCNAAVIVDPTSRVVKGLGLPRQQVHPLAHAVMEAVEAVAAADRQQWPEAEFPHAGRRRSSDGSDSPGTVHPPPPAVRSSRDGQDMAGAASAAGHHATLHLPEQPVASDPGVGSSPKRPRLLEGLEQQQQRQQQQQQTQQQEEQGLVAPAGQPLAPPSGAPTTQLPAATKPYVCTGYDCFVVQEPCSMCAMALVHSRVARVIFCRPDASHGALGGLYRLQSRRSLNHHYKVYHLALKEAAPAGQQQPLEQ